MDDLIFGLLQQQVLEMMCTSIELPSAPKLSVGVRQALDLLLLHRFGHAGIHP